MSDKGRGFLGKLVMTEWWLKMTEWVRDDTYTPVILQIKSASITEALNLYEHRLILLILIGKAYTPGNQGKIAYQRIRLFDAIIL